MLRRIVGWLVLVPLSLVLIVFALANRQLTVVNFNPFISPSALVAPGVGVPLFLVIFGVLLVGVVLGGVAGWFAQSEARRDRRRSFPHAAPGRYALHSFVAAGLSPRPHARSGSARR